jgi:hypothetical protein
MAKTSQTDDLWKILQKTSNRPVHWEGKELVGTATACSAAPKDRHAVRHEVAVDEAEVGELILSVFLPVRRCFSRHWLRDYLSFIRLFDRIV